MCFIIVISEINAARKLSVIACPTILKCLDARAVQETVEK